MQQRHSGAALENLTALSLLKYTFSKIDYDAEPYALHYLRTKEGAEVDFALVKKGEIQQLIEVKNSDADVSKSLYTFYKKYGFPSVQIVRHLRHERRVEGIEVRKAESFLAGF